MRLKDVKRYDTHVSVKLIDKNECVILENAFSGLEYDWARNIEVSAITIYAKGVIEIKCNDDRFVKINEEISSKKNEHDELLKLILALPKGSLAETEVLKKIKSLARTIGYLKTMLTRIKNEYKYIDFKKEEKNDFDVG